MVCSTPTPATAATSSSSGSVSPGLQTVVDMVVDQFALGRADGGLHGVQLLREVGAGATLFDHPDHRAEMALGALQSRRDRWMGGVFAMLCHCDGVSPGGG